MPVLARADVPVARPSDRPAATTLAMLAQYSPKDTSQDSVLDDLSSMLGKANNDGVGGKDGSTWKFYSYELDDYTQVIVEFIQAPGQDSPQLAMITAERPDKKLVRLGGVSGLGETAHHSSQR